MYVPGLVFLLLLCILQQEEGRLSCPIPNGVFDVFSDYNKDRLADSYCNSNCLFDFKENRCKEEEERLINRYISSLYVYIEHSDSLVWKWQLLFE